MDSRTIWLRGRRSLVARRREPLDGLVIERERDLHHTVPYYHTDMARLVGGLEAGGTKCSCAPSAPAPTTCARTANSDDHTDGDDQSGGGVLSPSKRRVSARRSRSRELRPCRSRPRSATYGSITTTPKPGWRHVDLVGPLRRALDIPVGVDTDVNGAALAEHRWGSGAACVRWSTSPSAAASAAGSGGRRVRFTGSSIPRWVTSGCLTIGRAIRSPACARTTATAGRAWPGPRAHRALGAAAGDRYRGPSGLGSRGGLSRAGSGERGARPLA